MKLENRTQICEKESLADRDKYSCPRLLHVFCIAPHFYKPGDAGLQSCAKLTFLIIQLSCPVMDFALHAPLRVKRIHLAISMLESRPTYKVPVILAA